MAAYLTLTEIKDAERERRRAAVVRLREELTRCGDPLMSDERWAGLAPLASSRRACHRP
jgi:hypothetical protein